VIDRDELGAWLTLLETPQLGRTSARRLLGAFGSPQAVLAAPTGALRDALGVALADALRDHDAGALAERTWTWLHEAPQRAVVALGDPGYPPLLLETGDPPLLLYLQGHAELLAAESVAIVGSRNPTAQGRDNAHALAAALSEAGFAIVSGLALGIDAAAHEGGLAGPGRTVAVVGTGLDRVYPRGNLALAHRIADEGLLVSEYALGTPPLAANFPLRNRIIAGLSRGTLVVEAATQSGSLITARLAAEFGREVFAVPGSIHSPQSRGCHVLIQQGAKLVLGVGDVLDELRPIAQRPPPAPPPAADRGDPVLDAMGFDPVGLDALLARTGWPAAELNARLLDLELAGRVARLPGQLFQRRGRS
jgi:DNA processing protein